MLSRYVIAHPKGMPLRLVKRNFDGTHEERDEGDLVVHVFERHESQRVLPEPATPPREWFLPWVELGMDDPVAGTDSMYRVQLLPYTAVTPR